MKKLCLCLTIFAALLFFAGCGSSKKENKNDEPDTGETVTDDDAVDTEPSGDTEPTDTEPADDSDTEPTEKPDEDGEKTPEELNKECQELGEESFYSEEDGTCLRVSICGERPDYTEWNQPPNPDDFAGLCYEYYENGSWPEEGYCDVVYGEEPGGCHFVCVENYTWNAEKGICSTPYLDCAEIGGSFDPEKSLCVRSSGCNGNPSYSEWNTGDAPGWCTEEYINGSWPEEGFCDVVYSEEPGGCHFKCSSGYIWHSSKSECEAIDYTGLHWSEKSEERMSADDAAAYCENLEEDGFTDWVLPTFDELRTLVQNCDVLMPQGECKVSEYCNSTSSCAASSNCFCDQDPDPEEGYYSRLGDNEPLWSKTKNSDGSKNWSLVFNATQAKPAINVTNAKVRCVRHYCEEGKIWDNSIKTCQTPSTRSESCGTLPDFSEWNTVSEIPQTWNSYSWNWEPPVNTRYNETPSDTECRFICASGYWWNGSSCIAIVPLGRICTGQTSCYNASSSMMCQTNPAGTDDTYNFYGQDAQHTDKCTEQSFTASSDVIKDNNTGLVWEISPSTDSYTWNDRETHCNELNSSNYGGKSNWRVPNPFELLTIVDNSKFGPAVNSNFTGIPADNVGILWTSKQVMQSDFYAYYFQSFNGYEAYTSKTDPHKVLCVSGNEMPGGVLTTQTLQDDVIVRDSTTDFMWQKEYVTDLTWQQALQYCEELTYAGYYGWRLPNKNELASLINHDKSWGHTHSDFPDMPDDYFWSSTTYASDKSEAWTTEFSTGKVQAKSKTETYNVRCVRK